MEVNELKADMDRQFEAVRRSFEETRAFIATEGKKTRRFILEEGERTRRHFDVAVEQVKAERNLALDKAIAADERTGRMTATNAADHVGFQARLDDHELRLTRLERKEES